MQFVYRDKRAAWHINVYSKLNVGAVDGASTLIGKKRAYLHALLYKT